MYMPEGGMEWAKGAKGQGTRGERIWGQGGCAWIIRRKNAGKKSINDEFVIVMSMHSTIVVCMAQPKA